MFFDPVTPSELSEISNAFRPGKAAGHDRIPISIIKQSIQIIAEPLAHIINLSITHGIVPDQMNIARVIPLFKACLLYTSDAADEEDSVDLGGRRIIKKKLR